MHKDVEDWSNDSFEELESLWLLFSEEEH